LIGLVLVSHSALLAAGLRELAAQMAPDVRIETAGGTDDGGLGTSLEKVTAAIQAADDGDGVVVLYDLGSAQMTAETALEMLDQDVRERTRVVDAPFVEGALTAATTAAGGASLSGVIAAVAGSSPPEFTTSGARGEVTLRNPLGLHARSAAMVVAALRGLDAEVVVRRTDDGRTASGRSLLALLQLGATGGTSLQLCARGPDAEQALDALQRMVDEGFGEPATP